MLRRADLRPTPPPNPLPPGVSPIIGPELATYGVVQPLARAIGTLDPRHARRPGRRHLRAGRLRRRAHASRRDSCGRPADQEAGRGADQEARACALSAIFALGLGPLLRPNGPQPLSAPSPIRSANGNLGGFQGGIDLLRGSLIAGHYERAGLYGAYGDVNADVDGLVTNPAATAYVLARTGSMNLDAWSAGGYWTHVGPGGWYLDAVLQGTWYYGSASTQFARLNTDGTGFIASLEGGYPFAWPQLGPGFVIEPQGQILWQKVSFRHDYDGLGDVALGDTTGPSGRIGLRTKWTIETAGGQVWQPYLRANLWRDWGAEANTTYSGTDIVPLAVERNAAAAWRRPDGQDQRQRLCSSPTPTMSSPSATLTVIDETASEAHWAPDIRGEAAPSPAIGLQSRAASMMTATARISPSQVGQLLRGDAGFWAATPTFSPRGLVRTNKKGRHRASFCVPSFMRAWAFGRESRSVDLLAHASRRRPSNRP